MTVPSSLKKNTIDGGEGPANAVHSSGKGPANSLDFTHAVLSSRMGCTRATSFNNLTPEDINSAVHQGQSVAEQFEQGYLSDQKNLADFDTEYERTQEVWQNIYDSLAYTPGQEVPSDKPSDTSSLKELFFATPENFDPNAEEESIMDNL